MPYSIGERGSYGCSGYPVVKDSDKEVMGCHETREGAARQIAAIEANENKEYAGIKDPMAWPESQSKTDGAMGQPFPASNRASLFRQPKRNPRRRIGGVGGDSAGAVATTGGGTGMGTKEYSPETANNISEEVGKESGKITEGSFVMGPTADGMAFGRVEHIMWEGGTLGQPGEEYSLESMPPENPAMSVRIFEVEDDGMEPTPYSIGMMYQDAQLIDVSNMTMQQENEMESMSKAETYSPTSGMKAAARRALKWKEEGKATGAGTAVGWGRARDIVAGRSMSLSVVKRMYSFFSRHEVDKKGKDFYNTSNPSNGRIMWDAWGGDAGYSWSRKIAEREKDKALFADFGKDFTRVNRLTEVFKADSVRVGQMVSWNSSGGTARGKVKRIITSGSYKVPGTDVTINGTEEDPAVVITLYRDGEATDTTVAHRRSTLRAS